MGANNIMYLNGAQWTLQGQYTQLNVYYILLHLWNTFCNETFSMPMQFPYGTEKKGLG